MTLTFDWPAGVFGGGGGAEGDDDELHPQIACPPTASNTANTNPRKRLRLPTATHGQSRTASNETDPSISPLLTRLPSPGPSSPETEATFTSVAIVIIVVAAAPFGVTLAGEKVQLAYAGRPLHANAVDAENVPTGVTLTVTLAEDPAAIVALAEESDSEKSGAGEIVSCTAAEVDPALPVSPEYTAVMLWGPTPSALVVYIATPADNVPLPSVVVPSRKFTEPVGCAVPLVSVTVAVNVTLLPTTALLLEADSPTWVTANEFTVSCAVAPVSPELLALSV